jgi:hypothetical protein
MMMVFGSSLPPHYQRQSLILGVQNPVKSSAKYTARIKQENRNKQSMTFLSTAAFSASASGETVAGVTDGRS